MFCQVCQLVALGAKSVISDCILFCLKLFFFCWAPYRPASLHCSARRRTRQPNVGLILVLLRWQEFATRSMAVFFDRPPQWRCRCRCWILVCVKARVFSWKQVNVTASRSFRLSWNVLIAHCTRRWGCTKWDRCDGLTRYSA